MATNITNVTKRLKTMQQLLGDHKFTLTIGWENEEMRLIAKTMEYGTLTAGKGNHTIIPSRPHRFQAIKKHHKNWIEFIANQLVDNNYDIEQTLRDLGEVVRRDWVASIKEGNYKALAPSTLRARKYKHIRGTLPLNATGEMARQLMWTLEEE